MTPAQCRAARALISISQDDLAKAAQVGVQSLIAFENNKRTPYARTLDAIRTTLESRGVELIPENGGGAGVRLRQVGSRNET